jgi:hypothetical protein
MAARQTVLGAMALSCLMGCGGAKRHAVAPGEHAESDVESRPLDKSALSEEARARFEEEKIKVVDSDSKSSSYSFQDGQDNSKQKWLRLLEVAFQEVEHANPLHPRIGRVATSTCPTARPRTERA